MMTDLIHACRRLADGPSPAHQQQLAGPGPAESLGAKIRLLLRRVKPSAAAYGALQLLLHYAELQSNGKEHYGMDAPG